MKEKPCSTYIKPADSGCPKIRFHLSGYSIRHYSQAERDYLRQKILEIFEEDESALKEQDESNMENNRKRGFSLPNDGIGRKSDSITNNAGQNIDLDNPKVDRKSTESGFESGSAGDMGSERLTSRSSLQFIDVPSDEKVSKCKIIILHRYFVTAGQKI